MSNPTYKITMPKQSWKGLTLEQAGRKIIELASLRYDHKVKMVQEKKEI